MKFTFWADPLCIEVREGAKFPWGFRLVRKDPFRHRILFAVFPLSLALRFFWKLYLWTFYSKPSHGEMRYLNISKTWDAGFNTGYRKAIRDMDGSYWKKEK